MSTELKLANKLLQYYKNGAIRKDDMRMFHIAHFTINNNPYLSKSIEGINVLSPNRINKSYHAEDIAIRKLCNHIYEMSLTGRLKRNRKISLNLYVISVSSTGWLISSRPCLYCLELLEKLSTRHGFKIKKIIYSHNGCLYEENFNEMKDANITKRTRGVRSF
jgi:hypothetical protein